MNVGTDTGIALACQGLGIGLEELGLDTLTPGAGIVVFGIIDLIKASRSGDWCPAPVGGLQQPRESLWLELWIKCWHNSWCIRWAKLGGAVGTFFCPGIGTAVGAGVRTLIGALGVRFGLSKTQLGIITKMEDRELVKKIAEQINPQMKEFGLELDTNIKFDDLQKKLKKGDIPFKITNEFTQLKDIALKDISSALGGKAVMNNFLDIAHAVNPMRIEGLKIVKKALGC